MKKTWKSRFDKILLKQQGNCEDQIYVIISAQIKVADNLGKKYLDYLIKSRDCDLDPRKIVITRGKYLKTQKTQIWIVPAGAESPTP